MCACMCACMWVCDIFYLSHLHSCDYHVNKIQNSFFTRIPHVALIAIAITLYQHLQPFATNNLFSSLLFCHFKNAIQIELHRIWSFEIGFTYSTYFLNLYPSNLLCLLLVSLILSSIVWCGGTTVFYKYSPIKVFQFMAITNKASINTCV